MGRKIWTAEAGALLVEMVDSGQGWKAISLALLRAGHGVFSADACEAYACRLGIAGRLDAIDAVDCRDTAGRDALLEALNRRHRRPPADIRPSRADGLRLNWRALLPLPCSGAGSPAGMCSENAGG